MRDMAGSGRGVAQGERRSAARWRRSAVVGAVLMAVLASLTTFGMSPASASDHTDPSGDNCKSYAGSGGPVQWCGPDISAASDPILSGEVHLIVSTNLAECAGNGVSLAGHVRYGIFKSSATTPNWTDELGEIAPDFGTNNFFYRVGATKTPLVSYVGTSGAPATSITYEVVLPTSITNGFGSGFKWMVGNDCIGEGPWEASDITPETGLYSVALSTPASAPAKPTGVAARPGSTTSTTTGPIIVSYLAGANNGSAITKFTATCTSSTGGVTKTGVHTGPTAGPITVNNATLKKSYTCTVKATNTKGTSPASAKTTVIIVGTPARPTKPTVAKVASGKLKVSFKALTAAQANGSALSTPKYSATCTSSDGGVTRTATGVGSPISVANLTAAKTYTCKVRAHNARGYGRFSPVTVALTA